ncbi:hypothetical protein [Novosphingobium taihuense]|uniref:Uncharacterized protein n=1 Tax=Novosphingobium taihuense TaxID=260085 RepID=A0A7W7AA42_9SPHN|nr:hypothetical protein [Novosphingobium taihuense]MBB4613086.1 hypothetical protein [Novosphingobium taihuense]
MIVPPNQAFSDHLVVGVAAFANNMGELLNCGLESVTFHYEGGTQVLTEPSVYTFTAASGEVVSYLGWWCALLNDGRHGEAQLYVEAKPRDATMQNRVIGPYLFLPSSTVHDLELEVAPSRAVLPGRRYQSIVDALQFCAERRSHRPLIRIVERRDDYLFGSLRGASAYVTAKGYVTIEATVPVTIIGTREHTDATPRPRYSGIRFKGPNITLDMATADRYFYERKGNQYWYDGVRVINSQGRGQLLQRLGGPRPGGFASGQPWLTECSVSDLPTTANGASLVRGCKFTRCFADAVSEAQCVIGSRFDDYDAYIDWAKDVPALTVRYAGQGKKATLQLSGDNNAARRVFTARVDGEVVGTFTTDRFYTVAAGRNSSVARWINSLPDWSAILHDDTRRASVLSRVGGKGAGFAEMDCRDAPLELVTMFDYHGDFYQQNTPAAWTTENVVVAGNVITNFAGQCFFISSVSPSQDFIFVENCFHGKPGSTGYNRRDHFFSQLDRKGPKSHVVFAHNSMTQGWVLRTAGGFRADRYCLWTNNVLGGLQWLGPAQPAIRLTRNYLFRDPRVPAGAIDTETGGTEADLFVDAQRGDFAPHGRLGLAAMAPVLTWDSGGRRLGRASPPGARPR